LAGVKGGWVEEEPHAETRRRGGEEGEKEKKYFLIFLRVSAPLREGTREKALRLRVRVLGKKPYGSA
jgi:hypothetical protein